MVLLLIAAVINRSVREPNEAPHRAAPMTASTRLRTGADAASALSTIQLDELTGPRLSPDAADNGANARCDREDGQWSRWRRSREELGRTLPAKTGKGPASAPLARPPRYAEQGESDLPDLRQTLAHLLHQCPHGSSCGPTMRRPVTLRRRCDGRQRRAHEAVFNGAKRPVGRVRRLRRRTSQVAASPIKPLWPCAIWSVIEPRGEAKMRYE